LSKNGGWGRIVLRGKKTGHPSDGKRPPQGRAKTRAKTRTKIRAKAGTRTKTEAGSATRNMAGGKPKPARQAGKAAADPALRRAKASIRNLKAELAEARARIDELQAWADTDFLLDVLNRRGFERDLARSLAYIRRYSGSGALIVLDVDGLKPINDTFGHAAGDVVL
jgi:predicted signal transduction protein with EAL and GGDEF domain